MTNTRSDEEVVRERWPDANSKFIDGSERWDKKSSWIIRQDKQFWSLVIGSGDDEASAWHDAAERIKNEEMGTPIPEDIGEGETVNYVGEVHPNPGNPTDANCSICGALLVCLSCGNHKDERIATLEQRVKELEAESDALRATVERLTRPVTDEERVEFKRKEMYRGGTLKALTSFIAARAKDTWKQGEGDPASSKTQREGTEDANGPPEP